MKIFHLFFVIGLLLVTFFWGQKTIQNAQQEAITHASERLVLTRDIRITQLNSDVKTIYSEIRFWAESTPLKEGMDEMLNAWDELSVNPKDRARQLYITENPLFPNYTDTFYKAEDGSQYSASHEKLHTLLKGLTKQRGYHDVFLIADNGDVIYTVFKEDDYATNLLSGKYKDSTLALGFREVLNNTSLNHVSLFDFIPYAPSKNAPASFIQTSIVDNKNKTRGVLAFQLPSISIDNILKDTSGLGHGVEIIAVGSDHLLRNHNNKQQRRSIIQSVAIDKALGENTGIGQFKDYRGVLTLTAYAPFHFSQNILGNTNKNTWAIIVKQDLSEIMQPVNARLKQWFSLLFALAVISLIFAWLLTRKKEDLSTTEE
jgi:hypothetical protein